MPQLIQDHHTSFSLFNGLYIPQVLFYYPKLHSRSICGTSKMKAKHPVRDDVHRIIQSERLIEINVGFERRSRRVLLEQAVFYQGIFYCCFPSILLFCVLLDKQKRRWQRASRQTIISLSLLVVWAPEKREEERDRL